MADPPAEEDAGVESTMMDTSPSFADGLATARTPPSGELREMLDDHMSTDFDPNQVDNLGSNLVDDAAMLLGLHGQQG